MKKAIKEMRIWGAILIPVIFSGFAMGFEGGGEGIL